MARVATCLALLFATLPLRAQIVTWLGGTGNWSNPLLWTLGVVPASGANVTIDGGNLLNSSVTLDVNATLSQLTIGSGDTLTIANNHTLTFAGTSGTLTNDGTLAFASVGNLTNLVISGGAFTFATSGAGVVNLSNTAANRIHGAGTAAALINAAGHTIQGAGEIGPGLTAITNRGLISATLSSGLTLWPSSGTFTNLGTLRAANGATLTLKAGTFANTGGLIEAHDHSHVDVVGATITGGTFTSVGAGHFHLSGNSTLSGLVITSGSNLELANNERSNLTAGIQNSGTIKLLSVGNFTDLVIVPNATAGGAILTGGGTILLSNHGNNRIYGAAATTTLVNQDNTIAGAGQLGVNQLALDNRGTISANHSGGTLTIDPGTVATINTGTLQATNGGILRLQLGTFTNTGGLVRAQSGSKVQLDTATLTNGTVDIAAGGTLELDTSTLSGATLTNANTGLIKTTGGSSTLGGTVTNAAGANLQIANNTSLVLESTGVFTNHGTISLLSVGNLTNLLVSGGTVTLSGTGSLNLSNNGNNRIYGVATTDRLVNAAGHTLQGSGQLGLGLMGFTNQGTVIADQPTSLVIHPSASGATNSGTLRATNNATLELVSGTFDNAGGTIEAQPGSTVRFENATIVRGTLASTGTGHLLNAASNVFNDITLAAGSIFDLVNNTTATFGGTFTNQGTVNLGSVGNFTNFIAAGPTLTLTGGGLVALSNNGNNRIYGDTTTTTLINLNNTLRGSGQLGVNTLQLDNRGTIEASHSGGTLTIDPSGTGATNTGTLQALNGGTLSLANGTFTNTGGTIRAQAGSTVRVDTATVTGGTFEVAATGTVALDTATINGGTFTGAAGGTVNTVGGSNVLGGIVTIDAATQLNVSNNTSLKLLASGTYTHNGTLALNSVGNLTDLIVWGGDVTLGGTGTIALGDNGANRIYGITATDRLVLGSGLTLRGGGQVGVNVMGLTNHGVIEAIHPATDLILDLSAANAVNTGTLRAISGATLRVTGAAYTNTGGTIAANDASRVVFEHAEIVGGTLSSTGTGRLVNAADSTFSGVTLRSGSILDIANNTPARFAGTFNNQGIVNLNSVGNFTDFVAQSGGLTLLGGGTINLGNNHANRIYAATTTTTLVNQDNTIRGAGQLGANQLQLDNRGTIEASINGATLTLATSGTGALNTGTLQAVNGATLLLEGSTIDNTGGTLRADAGSRVDLSSSTITGGTLTTVGSGLIRTTSGTSTLGGTLTLAAGSQLQLLNNTGLTLLASGVYTNNGLISLGSVGNLTDFKVSGGDVALGGTGKLSLGHNTANRIFGLAGTDRLVNTASHTIEGAGQLGLGLMGLVNQGLIRATFASPLTINPSAAGVTNTGRLRADAGATLRLESGTFNNHTGTIEALGTGAVVEFSGATIVKGTLASDAGATLRHAGGSTFSDVLLAGGSNFIIPNNTAAHFTGTFTNAARVALNSVGNNTDFIIDGDVILDGSGTIVLGDNFANRLYASAATSVLTNKNNVIQGSGQLGLGLMGFVNQRTIVANQSTPLAIDPSAAGFVNTGGTLRATDGATLRLEHGAFNNTGGIIEATGAGSLVTFDNAAITSGQLLTANGGLLRNVASSTFTDITLGAGATLQIANNTSATFNGLLTSAGTIQLNSVGNVTNLLIGPAGLKLVGGIVELGDNFANRIYSSSGTSTLINDSATIRGAGQLGVGLAALDNRGTINANLAGSTLLLDPNSTGALNTGLLTATNGGILRLKGGTYTNTGGHIAAGPGSRIELESATIAGGTLGGALLRSVASSTLSSLTIASGTRLEVANNTALTLVGAIANSGVIALSSVGNNTDLVIGTGGVTLTGGGTIELSNNGANRVYGTTGAVTLDNVNNTLRGAGQLGLGQLVLRNTGTIEASQSTPLTVNLSASPVFTNQGHLRATGGGSLVFTDALANASVATVNAGSVFQAQGAYTQTNGATVLGGGTFTAASISLQGGTLYGSGTVNGPVTSSVMIAPGPNGSPLGAGLLTFNHALTLTSTALLHFELGGVATYDRIVAQSATLNGNLLVVFADGFQSSILPTDSFTLLSTSTAGLTGTFANLSPSLRLFTADGAGSFQVSFLGNAVTLSNFQAIPEPSTYALLALGGAIILLTLRRRKK